MEIEEDEEEINMCRAIDEMMAEAREEGREAGMRLGEKRKSDDEYDAQLLPVRRIF